MVFVWDLMNDEVWVCCDGVLLGVVEVGKFGFLDSYLMVFCDMMY